MRGDTTVWQWRMALATRDAAAALRGTGSTRAPSFLKLHSDFLQLSLSVSPPFLPLAPRSVASDPRVGSERKKKKKEEEEEERWGRCRAGDGKQVEVGELLLGEGGGKRRDYHPSSCGIISTSHAAFTPPGKDGTQQTSDTLPNVVL